MRPGDRDRAALDEGAEVGRRDAALARFAGDVDLDEHAQVRRRVALELLEHGVRATEWIRRTSGATCLTLRLCRWPMKSHPNVSP